MGADILQIMSILVWMALFVLGSTEALRCWQCIADNCDIDPAENYKATEKECQPGGYCQKVIYGDHYNNKTNPVSIVRSCSKRCEPKDNFSNCTWSKRGCVTRLCCQDSDFCNSGEFLVFPWRLVYVGVAAFFYRIYFDGRYTM